MAHQGLEIYRANNCAACHSQQVGQTGIAVDVVLTDAGTNLEAVASVIKKTDPSATAAGLAGGLPKTVLHGGTIDAADALVKSFKTAGAKAQTQLVPLGPDRALAVLVGADGTIENRIVHLDGLTSAEALNEVTNFINAHLSGLTLAEAQARLLAEIRDRREALDRAAAELIASGLAAWSEDHARRPVLIVRGQANLIDDDAAADLERVRSLLEELENRQEIARLLEGARDAPGCRIFIGSENRMFALSGSSVIAAPYRGSQGEVVGVVGVIGPTRLNYARVIPMVDFTAKALTRLMA